MEKKNESLRSAGINPTPDDTELTALNVKLYSEFSLNELEERLETDPLLFSARKNARETAPARAKAFV